MAAITRDPLLSAEGEAVKRLTSFGHAINNVGGGWSPQTVAVASSSFLHILIPSYHAAHDDDDGAEGQRGGKEGNLSSDSSGSEKCQQLLRGTGCFIFPA